jgi:hypothetical protein
MNKDLTRKVIKERYCLLPSLLPITTNLFLSSKVRNNDLMHRGFIKNRVIFTHIPKAAGSSIGIGLIGHDKVGHYPLKYLKALYPKYFNDFYKFTVVRNPWDRLVSAFFYLNQGGKGKWDSSWVAKVGLKGISFNDFVMKWLNEKSIYSFIHFVPQVNFVCDRNGNNLVDLIIKLEFLNDGLNVLKDKTGIELTVGSANKSQRKGYHDYFTPEMVERVRELYKEDIEFFNYEY